MNRNDVIDVLTAVAAADRRTVGEADVDIWLSVLVDLPLDSALEAVRDHLREQPDTWMQPGHVYQRARRLRAVRAQESVIGEIRAIERPPASADARRKAIEEFTRSFGKAEDSACASDQATSAASSPESTAAMPDRYLDENGFVIDLDAPDSRHLTAEDRRLAAIADCQLCNRDGYRTGGTRCDHIDHAAIAERHRAEIAAQLAQIAARKETPTTTPDRSHSEP